MTGPISRIILRVLSGYLMAGGWIPEDMAAEISADPDVLQVVQAGVGGTVWAATETWYWLAKKWGWRT